MDFDPISIRWLGHLPLLAGVDPKIEAPSFLKT